MSHVFKDKSKLMARVRRIRGQVEAIERTLENGEDCLEVLQLIASVRGAMNGLMGELIEGHVEHHIVEVEDETARHRGAQELAAILKTYLK